MILSPAKAWRKQNFRYKFIDETRKKSFLFEQNNTATLETWSVVRSAPEGFEEYVPYIVAIVKLNNGERITSQIVDSDIASLQKGQQLGPTFRVIKTNGKDGIIEYGIKWKIIDINRRKN